jgi:S-adenosylmethionine decarboxylase
MITDAGREWIVDAMGCPAAHLRDRVRLEALVGRIVEECGLSPVAPPVWHVFPGEGGMTAMLLLAESHLTLHTYPELGLATLNLYCCRPRAPWPWSSRLGEALGATEVTVRELPRGDRATPRDTLPQPPPSAALRDSARRARDIVPTGGDDERPAGEDTVRMRLRGGARS